MSERVRQSRCAPQGGVITECAAEAHLQTLKFWSFQDLSFENVLREVFKFWSFEVLKCLQRSFQVLKYWSFDFCQLLSSSFEVFKFSKFWSFEVLKFWKFSSFEVLKLWKFSSFEVLRFSKLWVLLSLGECWPLVCWATLRAHPSPGVLGPLRAQSPTLKVKHPSVKP